MKPAKNTKTETTVQQPPEVKSEGVAAPTIIEQIAPPAYEWEAGNVVHILMPVMNGRNPSWATTYALSQLFEKDKMKITIHPNNFHVRGRNHLVDVFLEGGCKYALWLDDDIVPPFGDVGFFRGLMNNPSFPEGFIKFNPIARLISTGHDIVSGCYFAKNFYGTAQYAEAYDSRMANEVSHYGPRNLVTETRWVPFGFTLVRRDVFIKIAETFPENAVTSAAVRKQLGYSYRYFNPQGDSIDASEDCAFCFLAQKAGFKTFIDHSIMPIHMGDLGYNYHNTRPAPLPV